MAGEVRIEKVQVYIELRFKVASLSLEAEDDAILWRDESRLGGDCDIEF